MNLEKLSSNQLVPTKEITRSYSWFALFFLILSFIGLLDSSYLTAKHFLGGIVPCTFGNCELVLTSQYSVFHGIPVALFGGVYYLIFFVSIIFYFDSKNDKILKYTSRYSILGLLASIWFVYLQLFIIHSICEFCMLSALTSGLLFIGGVIYVLRKSEKRT
jgi:uncharacterized membrane protein